MSAERSQKPVAFFQYGVEDTGLHYDYEDALVGNRAGFEALRAKIDELLDGGDELVLDDPEVRTDFTYLKLAEREPGAAEGVSGRWVTIGCIAAFVVGMAVFVAGLMKIWEWIF